MPTLEAAPEVETLAEPLAEEAWEKQGHGFALRANATCWEIGDWIVRAETDFDGEDKERRPRRYQRAANLTELKYGTLRNRASVARAFPVSRRRDNLPFAHHAAVARRDDAEDWLARAEEHGWSEKDLRRKLSEASGTEPTVRPVRVILSIDPDLHAEFLEAAGGQDEVKDWAIEVLQDAVRRGEA